MFAYDFGYSWWILNGHLLPMAVVGALAAIAVWRRWRGWLVAAFTVIALWALASFVIVQALRFPADLPSEQFLTSGVGRVLDVGAGSGRLTIGVLPARPQTRVTALDIFDGYFG